jgi:phosphoglycerate kinase
MAYTFMKGCYGMEIGKSPYDTKGEELTPKLLKKAQDEGGVKQSHSPSRLVENSKMTNKQLVFVTKEQGIPKDMEGMDCGAISMKLFHDQIMKSKTVTFGMVLQACLNSKTSAKELNPCWIMSLP